MVDLKDYRNKELRYYIIANIAVLLLLLDFFHLSQARYNINIIKLIFNFFKISIISSIIYVLSLIADSLFSAEFKILLICGRSPGEIIFTRIQNKNIDKRFTSKDVQEIYSNIYKSKPKKKKDKYFYENTEWYKIYSKYRDVSIIMVSNRDFLLCRDIYFSTIISIIIYFGLTLVIKVIVLDWRYISYLLLMLIITNIGTRNKSNRLVNNVIALDIANYKTILETKENYNG
jgi:hypothetical protein